MIAKVRYIKEEQKETKYFFNLKKNKRDLAIIKVLQNKNKKIIIDTNEICKIATEYHQILQKVSERQKDKTQNIKEILNNITNKLKKENQELLSKSTNEKEINIPYKFYRLWTKEYKDYKDKEKTKNPKKLIADIIYILKEVYNKIEEKGLKDKNFILETIFLLYKIS